MGELSAFVVNATTAGKSANLRGASLARLTAFPIVPMNNHTCVEDMPSSSCCARGQQSSEFLMRFQLLRSWGLDAR